MFIKTCGATLLPSFIQIHARMKEELRRQAKMCKNSLSVKDHNSAKICQT